MNNTFLDWFSQGFEREESLVYEGVIHLQFYIIRAKSNTSYEVDVPIFVSTLKLCFPVGHGIIVFPLEDLKVKKLGLAIPNKNKYQFGTFVSPYRRTSVFYLSLKLLDGEWNEEFRIRSYKFLPGIVPYVIVARELCGRSINKLKRMKWRCPHCMKKNTVLLKECLHCGGILLEDPLQ